MTATTLAASGATGPITVEAVDSKARLNQFIRLPWKIFAGDAAWVPPLISEIKKQLSPKNPFFGHATGRYFLAFREGRPVGRISAQVDRLAIEKQGQKVGHFGFLDAIDDRAVFAALFTAAEDWLRERGMERVVGPYSLSVNQESGLLVDGFTTPPMMMMGHARPWYGPHVEALGYTKVKDLYAYLLDIRGDFPPLIDKLVDRSLGQGRIRLRDLDMRHFHRDLADIIAIYNEAWADNWGAVALTDAEALADARAMRPIVNSRLIKIAEIDGQAVGMMATLPNINEVIRDLGGRLFPFGWAKVLWRLKVGFPKTVRVVMMGVLKKYQATPQGAAIAFMLITLIRREARALGVTHGELSWVLEDNQGMRQIAETIRSDIYKTYRIYSKPLI